MPPKQTCCMSDKDNKPLYSGNGTRCLVESIGYFERKLKAAVHRNFMCEKHMKDAISSGHFKTEEWYVKPA